MPGARINITPRPEWAPTPRDRTAEPQGHKCGNCWTPYGKSAVPCPNEPPAKPRTQNQAMRDIFAEAEALSDQEGIEL